MSLVDMPVHLCRYRARSQADRHQGVCRREQRNDGQFHDHGEDFSPCRSRNDITVADRASRSYSVVQPVNYGNVLDAREYPAEQGICGESGGPDCEGPLSVRADLHLCSRIRA